MTSFVLRACVRAGQRQPRQGALCATGRVHHARRTPALRRRYGDLPAAPQGAGLERRPHGAQDADVRRQQRRGRQGGRQRTCRHVEPHMSVWLSETKALPACPKITTQQTALPA